MQPIHLFDVPKFGRRNGLFVVTLKSVDIQFVIDPHIFRECIDGADAEWLEFVADGGTVAMLRKGR